MSDKILYFTLHMLVLHKNFHVLQSTMANGKVKHFITSRIEDKCIISLFLNLMRIMHEIGNGLWFGSDLLVRLVRLTCFNIIKYVNVNKLVLKYCI